MIGRRVHAGRTDQRIPGVPRHMAGGLRLPGERRLLPRSGRADIRSSPAHESRRRGVGRLRPALSGRWDDHPAQPPSSVTKSTAWTRLQQRIPIAGRVSIDGIFEVFNLFDRANFGSYTLDETSSDFLQTDRTTIWRTRRARCRWGSAYFLDRRWQPGPTRPGLRSPRACTASTGPIGGLTVLSLVRHKSSASPSMPRLFIALFVPRRRDRLLGLDRTAVVASRAHLPRRDLQHLQGRRQRQQYNLQRTIEAIAGWTPTSSAVPGGVCAPSAFNCDDHRR